MADDAAAPEGELTESAGVELTESVTDLEEASESPETDTPDSETTEVAEAAESVDDDAVEFVDEDAVEDAAAADVPKKPPMSRVKLATIVGLVVVVALGGLVGWLGWRANESRQAEQQRQLFLQVGRQAAINLTTIDYNDADAAVERILESATDTFYDDFSQRSQPFAEVVRQAKSTSSGEVTSAGLESIEGDHAQVLVAVTVKTSNVGAQEQPPRSWRMRITVKQVGPNEAKVSNVGFVP